MRERADNRTQRPSDRKIVRTVMSYMGKQGSSKEAMEWIRAFAVMTSIESLRTGRFRQILQNKANLPNVQMHVNFFSGKDYASRF